MAAYSVGQLVASPVLGVWADHRPTREPLIVSLCINVVFSVLYSYAGAFPQHVSGWVVLVCRALIGFGAGNAAIVRSYVSEATTEKERVGAMAAVSGSQAIGFIIGPGMLLLLIWFASTDLLSVVRSGTANGRSISCSTGLGICSPKRRGLDNPGHRLPL